MKKQKQPVPPAEAEPVIKKQPLLKRLLYGPERPDRVRRRHHRGVGGSVLDRGRDHPLTTPSQQDQAAAGIRSRLVLH